MESSLLKKIAFMTQSQYSSITTKSKDTIYMVESTPDLGTFPDYSSGVTIAPDTEYTIGEGALSDYSAGWFRIGLTSTSNHGHAPQIYLYINGQKFNINYGCAFTMTYLTNGNTLKCLDHRNTGSWSKVQSTFFPMVFL